MLNQWTLKIQQMPKLLFGFIVILIAMVVTVYRDPPTTQCQIQMEQVQKRLVNGFYQSYNRGKYQSGILSSFQNCLDTNSPGGCLDLFKRLDFFEEQIRTVPTHCGQDPATDFVRKALLKALRLLVRISWGDQPPINKYNKTAWLDTADLGLYCRLKRQFVRLYGKETYKSFAWFYIPKLPEATTLERRDQWNKSLFSYPCKGLY